jgi:hypothetical protein
MYKVRNFHEGHSTVGEWQGSGRIVAGSWQGNGMVCVKRPLIVFTIRSFLSYQMKITFLHLQYISSNAVRSKCTFAEENRALLSLHK